MKPVEEGGQWWLPETPDAKVSGVFRIDDKGKSQLTLIGELRNRLHDAERHDRPDGSVEFRFTESSLDRAGSYPRVLGRTGSNDYTLEGGLRTRHSANLLGGLPSEAIMFNQVFRGALFEHGEELAFDRVSVSMRWLTHWVAQTSLEETHEWVEGRQVSFTLRGSGLASRRVRLGGGLTVYVHHSLGLEGNEVTHRGLTQQFVFETRSTSLLPLENLMETPARLQALVSIGTGRTAGYDELVLNHPGLVFFQIRTLRAGNQVNVSLADGAIAHFQVTAVAMYAKDQFPAQQGLRTPRRQRTPTRHLRRNLRHPHPQLPLQHRRLHHPRRHDPRHWAVAQLT